MKTASWRSIFRPTSGAPSSTSAKATILAVLTTDLLSVRIVRGEVRPRYVDPQDADLLALAARLIETFETGVGSPRHALEAELRELTGTGTAFIFHRALAKLLADRCAFATEATAEPEVLRRSVFETAAASYREGAHERARPFHFHRDEVLARVGAALEMSAGELEQGLYADLKDEQILQSFEPCQPSWLLERYNVSLAQGVLLRASELRLELSGLEAKQLRALFRKIKFFQLMHTVQGDGRGGFVVHLDGPMSLFKSSLKYGLQMASFLPTLLHFEGWKLEAEIAWGKRRERRSFRLAAGAGLRPIGRLTGQWQPEELGWLPGQLAELGSEWSISSEAELIDLGGEGVMAPDFVFIHEPSGTRVVMEVFGFWRRGAVATRLALLRRHGPKNLIVAISKQLAASEEDLEDLPGEVYVFRSQPLARQVLALLEKMRLG